MILLNHAYGKSKISILILGRDQDIYFVAIQERLISGQLIQCPFAPFYMNVVEEFIKDVVEMGEYAPNDISKVVKRWKDFDETKTAFTIPVEAVWENIKMIDQHIIDAGILSKDNILLRVAFPTTADKMKFPTENKHIVRVLSGAKLTTDSVCPVNGYVVYDEIGELLDNKIYPTMISAQRAFDKYAQYLESRLN